MRSLKFCRETGGFLNRFITKERLERYLWPVGAMRYRVRMMDMFGIIDFDEAVCRNEGSVERSSDRNCQGCFGNAPKESPSPEVPPIAC